jgi:YidC/Oxa1 family membrane protein insertase
MEKRALLAVVLMVAVIFLSNVLFPPPEPPPGEIAADSAEAVTPVEREERVPPPALDTAAPAVVPREQAVEAVSAAEAETDTVRVVSDLYDLRFSTLGGALVYAELLEYLSFAPNGAGQKNVQLVRPGDTVLGYRIALGGDTISLDRQTFRTERSEIRLTEESPEDSLELRYAFPGGNVEFVVTYRFMRGSHLIAVAGRLEGLSDRGYAVLTSLGRGLQTNEKNPNDDYRQLGYVVNGRRGIRSVELDKIDPGEIRTAEGGPFGWVAVKNKYFLMALVAPEEGPQFGGLIATGTPEEHTTGLVASLPVPAGSTGFRFRAYIGPQEYSRLDAVGQDLEHANPYGWRWMRPIIRPLVGIVMIALTWLHSTLNLAYGWVLILFGVLMRVVLFPLYQKSMRAQMAQMQVQPLMKELQTKYKDEPQKLQQEMMKLYKEHNVNPLAGCLPMLLPMPILFALFFVFQSTIEFRGVPFLWLPDLSLKDPIYVIPLVMGLSMFLLTWIGQRGMETNAQMKMMGWMMPVVFTVLFMNFPSGLNLYYATSNLASLPQQLYLSRERKAARAKAEQTKAEMRKAEEARVGSGKRKKKA